MTALPAILPLDLMALYGRFQYRPSYGLPTRGAETSAVSLVVSRVGAAW